MRSCYNCVFIDRLNIKTAMDGTYTYRCKKSGIDCVAGYIEKEEELKFIACDFYKSSKTKKQLNIFNTEK